MSTLVLKLADLQATLEIVGGKGMSLAKLTRAGLPVPGGFHLTTEAYRRFVSENGLQPRILAALKGVEAADPTTLEPVSQAIGGWFAEGRIPAEIVEAVTAAYAGLQPLSAVSVAVRSSATAEDLPGASFAGQQETYLNLRGPEAVLEAIKKCWASLWTARAIAYRANQGIDPESVALAVVVQELVLAEAAGVLFTVNPVNGKRDEMMITATWGLGEALVSGAVTPDTLTVEKATGKLIHRETAAKQVMTVRTETGTCEVPVPDSKKKKAVLTDKQAAELAALGRQIEQLYAMPMDIEWTLAGGKFAIVQARPITALPEPPLEWPLPHPKAVMARGSFAEFVPEPISPLFATLAVPITRESTLKMMFEMGMTEKNSYLFEVINNYVYVGFMFTPKILWQMVKMTFAMTPRVIKTSEQKAVVAREKFGAMVQKWQPREAVKLTPSELLAGVREIFGMTAEFYNMAQSATIPLSLTSEAVFGKYYAVLVKRQGDPQASTFLFGAENQALRAEKALFDLAAWAKEQPELVDYLTCTPAENICHELGVAARADFSTRFGAFLSQYGHAIYNLDFAEPIPLDDPAPLVETLKVYLSGKNNPYERQQAALRHSQQATEAISKRLDPLRRRYFLKLLKWAQDTAPLRENSIADLGLGHPQIRRLLGEFGRRLVEGGALTRADEIYWLEAQELDELARQLENGEKLESFSTQVEKRKAKWQSMRHVTPPNTLPMVGWMSKFYADNEQTGNVIKGFGASAGQFTGRACVMLGPEDFAKLQPGDILVAGITTPAWTPLFARASAIVTDIGGPLSHSSIVAREYGLPAVLATGIGTRRIKDGQTITVDGTAGLVTLREGGSIGGELAWTPPNPKGIYMRTSIADLMPNPLSPLYATWAVPALRGKMKPLGVRLKLSEPVLMEDYYTSINGYAYMNAAFPAKAWWWIITGMLPAYPSLLRRLVSLWRDELHPEYCTLVDRYRSKAPERLSSGELWQDAQTILEAAMYYACGLLFATMGASAGSEGLLTQVYNKMVKREGDPEATCLLMGWDNLPIRAEKSLFDLAVWVKGQSALAEYFLETTAEEFARRLTGHLAPDGITVEAWQELCARLEAHFQRFGHILFQMDFAEPLPLDHPELILENLKMYLRGEGTNPHERQRASEEKRIQTSETMLKRLKGLKLWAFRKALNWGQSLAEVREDALAEIGLGYPILRAMLRELGSRFVQAGAIARAEDIYWLELDEVRQSVIRLEQAQGLEDLSARVEQRKAFNEQARQATPPPMIPMKKRYMGFDTALWLAESEANRAGNRLKGVATSAGKVTAPARVLHGPEDFGQMRPGEVLVAGTTTPAWTPLFAMAAAVVTDIGGPLSHGSIVAREYGIPAVMGTGVATRRIQNGQMVTVDGSAGIVELK